MEDRSQLGNNSGSVKSTGQVLVNGQTGSWLPRGNCQFRMIERQVLPNARTLSGVTGAGRQSLDEMRTAGHFG